MTRILLAEEDVLVATDLACELEAMGLVISAMTRSVKGVLKAVEVEEVDFGVLNVSLPDGPSYPAAHRLRALGIPFAFLTSYNQADIEAEFRDIPRLSKPQDPRMIARSIMGLTRTDDVRKRAMPNIHSTLG